MELLKQYGLCQSFSRVGIPADNAWVESFFATMKKELIHRTHYETKESVNAAVFEYIYCFYNVKRIQKNSDICHRESILDHLEQRGWQK